MARPEDARGGRLDRGRARDARAEAWGAPRRPLKFVESELWDGSATRDEGPYDRGILMVDPAVVLPEPRPEDDEDVVWGLSTARTLWGRGERRDAIVWLRRAAEAATNAGQDFRASALGMYARGLEERLATIAAHAAAAPAAYVSEDTEDRLPEIAGDDTISDEELSPTGDAVSVDFDVTPEPPRRPAPPPPPPAPPASFTATP